MSTHDLHNHSITSLQPHHHNKKQRSRTKNTPTFLSRAEDTVKNGFNAAKKDFSIGNVENQFNRAGSSIKNKLSSAETSIVNGYQTAKSDAGAALNKVENFSGFTKIKHAAEDVLEMSPLGMAYLDFGPGHVNDSQLMQDARSILPQGVQDLLHGGFLVAMLAGGAVLYFAYQNRSEIAGGIKNVTKGAINTTGGAYIPGFKGF